MPAETIRTEVAHLTTGVTLVRTYVVTKHGRSIELVTRAQADKVTVTVEVYTEYLDAPGVTQYQGTIRTCSEWLQAAVSGDALWSHLEGADHMGRMNRARLARGQAALVVP